MLYACFVATLLYDCKNCCRFILQFTILLYTYIYTKPMDTFRKELRLAVLIDADNVSYTHVKEMLEEIAKSGTPTIKRIYAD